MPAGKAAPGSRVPSRPGRAAACSGSAGFLLGGWIGPGIARRLPGHSLRRLAAACGLAVAVKLGYDAYAR
ncbi:hypothetical protein AB0L05_08090 [Nonomuraea pusilla]|uniref:hypothetical protein n=1 Tax=Nonomuraea pusilla TaxID=46177 RepID=UPI00332BFE10